MGRSILYLIISSYSHSHSHSQTRNRTVRIIKKMRTAKLYYTHQQEWKLQKTYSFLCGTGCKWRKSVVVYHQCATTKKTAQSILFQLKWWSSRLNVVAVIPYFIFCGSQFNRSPLIFLMKRETMIKENEDQDPKYVNKMRQTRKNVRKTCF